MEDAAGWVCLRCFYRRVITIERRAVGADLFIVIAHIDEDMRMIERHGCARAHEFLDADFDHAMSAVVLEVGNGMPGHSRLQMRFHH